MVPVCQEGAEKFQREGNTDGATRVSFREKNYMMLTRHTTRPRVQKKSAGALLLKQRQPCGAQPGLHGLAHLGRIYGRHLGTRPIPGHITMHAASERTKGR